MATIKFLLQSDKNPANIYVRLIDGKNIDIKTKTNFIINPLDWSKSKQKPKSLQNINHKNLDIDLQNFRNALLNYYNTSGEVKNLVWLKNFINPALKNEIPTNLVEYFDFYMKERETELTRHTILRIKVVQKKIKAFEKDKKTTYQVKDVNISFKNEFEKYNIAKGYNGNTIANLFKEIKTVCRHAKRRGLTISPELDEIKTVEKKAISIFLTFAELEQIEKTKIKTPHLQSAKEWLLISCYTGQRVSDFMRFTKEMIREQDGKQLIEFTQQKTGKIMTLPLHKKVIAILNQRNGNFPTATSSQKYNVAIKKVCEIAELNEIVFGGKNDSEKQRKVFKNYPKHELVTSHIGRRSFATNFYGTIPTSLLISATGHATEQMFLNYIGKSSSDKALELANYF